MTHTAQQGHCVFCGEWLFTFQNMYMKWNVFLQTYILRKKITWEWCERCNGSHTVTQEVTRVCDTTNCRLCTWWCCLGHFPWLVSPSDFCHHISQSEQDDADDLWYTDWGVGIFFAKNPTKPLLQIPLFQYMRCTSLQRYFKPPVSAWVWTLINLKFCVLGDGELDGGGDLHTSTHIMGSVPLQCRGRFFSGRQSHFFRRTVSSRGERDPSDEHNVPKPGGTGTHTFLRYAFNSVTLTKAASIVIHNMFTFF